MIVSLFTQGSMKLNIPQSADFFTCFGEHNVVLVPLKFRSMGIFYSFIWLKVKKIVKTFINCVKEEGKVFTIRKIF